ncbi:MAG: hypothetical protein A2172_02275 [Candidatus Woykebacteria bacterium RBG_13_40_15]|uniref:Uncharacterized protein n=1 Tax=Candidatus Woykebacteria bacterium RBG_13_40_15 TaxID=1802593 RepID=A0A1G1W647_9BACT|nr:MAG: hypothetical protein A2172_02275 [Candidatus Woykebacteria bacterium RBG_13_40_15]
MGESSYEIAVDLNKQAARGLLHLPKILADPFHCQANELSLHLFPITQSDLYGVHTQGNHLNSPLLLLQFAIFRLKYKTELVEIISRRKQYATGNVADYTDWNGKMQ